MASPRTKTYSGEADQTLLPVIDEVVTGKTLEEAARGANSEVTAREVRRKRLGVIYAHEPKVTVMIAPMYAQHFGKVMHVTCNGISIAVPCNGTPYEVPETFACEVQRRLRGVNEMENKHRRFADVAQNNERAPGELALY